MSSVVCVIDIGNTRAKSALFPTVSSTLPSPVSEILRTEPDNGPPWEFLLAALWSGTLSGIVLGGSRPALVQDWAKAISHRIQLVPQQIPILVHTLEHHSQIGVPLDVSLPERVGLDRLFSARAAISLQQATPTPRIVVSTGTATTIDLITREGHFAGGVILPGVDLGGQALHDHTELLPRVILTEMPASPPVLGRDTRAALTAGLYWGQIGSIGEIVRRLSSQYEVKAPVLVTGGAAPRLEHDLRSTGQPLENLQHIPHLTLAGLALCFAPKQ